MKVDAVHCEILFSIWTNGEDCVYKKVNARQTTGEDGSHQLIKLHSNSSIGTVFYGTRKHYEPFRSCVNCTVSYSF